MEQRTEEWLKMRRTKVTSTDAAVVMGVGYDTPYQRWMKKLGLCEETKTTTAMQHGTDLEPVAMKLFQSKTGISMEPACLIKDFQMTSLDGYCPERNEFVEIKCPYSNETDHHIALEGKIPEKYIPQVAHHFLVTGAKNGWYFSYFHGSQALIYVNREIIKQSYYDKLMEKEREFYDCIQNLTSPELTDRDYVDMENDSAFKAAVLEWKSIKTVSEKYAEAEKEYRDKLIKLCQNKSCVGYGVKVTKSVRRGNIDYNSIPELKLINIDAYRREPSEAWRITLKD